MLWIELLEVCCFILVCLSVCMYICLQALALPLIYTVYNNHTWCKYFMVQVVSDDINIGYLVTLTLLPLIAPPGAWYFTNTVK